MAFKQLNKKLQEGLKKLGFDNPTLPQELGIPKILSGKDVLIIAPTGLGKTETVVLPVFSMWLERKVQPTSILYITPLKSLNRDLLKRFVFWSDELGINISVRHGDTTAYERKKQADFPDDMLVTTPETLQAILPAKKMRENLRNVKFVIIDEVHELAESKRGTQLSIALQRLKQLCTDYQLIMLSATVGEPEKIAKYFAGEKNVEIVKSDFVKKIKIDVVSPNANDKHSEIAEKISSNLQAAARLDFISNTIKNHKSTLIFTNTRDFAEILTSRMKHAYPEISIDNHHSSLSKSVRIKVEEDFKNEKLKAIVATSSLELGIDIGSVDFILHYMSPRQPSRALQRIGRAGHQFNLVSEGMIIATDIDDCFESAVIAQQALKGALQKSKLHTECLDVLAHQIIGILRDNYKMKIDDVYNIVKKSDPYKNLTKQKFMSVCLQLSQLRYLFINEDEMKISKKGLIYYLENLSTIPDSKNYSVVNILTHEKVGTLDEEFVAVNAEEGSTFIMKGEPWRVVSIDKKEVMVEPSGDIQATIPGWEGELMPVPYEVAIGVGKLRDHISKLIDLGYSKKDVVNDLMKGYPVDENTAKRMANIVKKQKKYLVPTNNHIVVEYKDDKIIIHSCFGNKVNETIGRYLTSLLSMRFGSVGLKIDPYRIILEMQSNYLNNFKEIFLSAKQETIEPIIDASLPNTKLFQWKFLHVARRFGVISRDAQLGKIMMSKIIDLYRDSPVWQETIKEIKTEKLDVERAAEIFEKISKNEIKISFINKISPLGRLGIKMKREVVGPEKADIQIMDIFKKRLLSKKVKLVCMNCGKWSMTLEVKDIPEVPRCSKCNARLITAHHPRFDEGEKIIQKSIKQTEMTQREKEILEKMRKISDLIIVYGKKAVIALTAKGVGPKVATRILRNVYTDEDSFYKALLEAEKTFVRTKKFWK
ncbi:MAG: DEAD/DEAH box helicase [Candidatus Aenigmarchaeota archaeon]|nr:DEAD/DEAH box helicase [Candidatus Aenigmarchaeota archaeon]